MNPDDQEAFRDLTSRPELRGLGEKPPPRPETFYGLIMMSLEILVGGLAWLYLGNVKYLVAAVFLVIATFLIVAAITTRRG